VSLVELALALIVVLLIVILILVATQKGGIVRRMSGELGSQLETKHRAMIGDVGGMFNQVSERVGRELTTASSGTREVIGTLQVQVVHTLSQQTEASLKQLALLQLDERRMKERRSREYGKLDRMESYVGARCRRRYVIEYFGEKAPFEACGTCDVCREGRSEPEEARASPQATRQDHKRIKELERDLKRFWTQHLARWVRGYARLIEQVAEHSFYRGMAGFLHGFQTAQGTVGTPVLGQFDG